MAENSNDSNLSPISGTSHDLVSAMSNLALSMMKARSTAQVEVLREEADKRYDRESRECSALLHQINVDKRRRENEAEEMFVRAKSYLDYKYEMLDMVEKELSTMEKKMADTLDCELERDPDTELPAVSAFRDIVFCSVDASSLAVREFLLKQRQMLVENAWAYGETAAYHASYASYNYSIRAQYDSFKKDTTEMARIDPSAELAAMGASFDTEPKKPNAIPSELEGSLLTSAKLVFGEYIGCDIPNVMASVVAKMSFIKAHPPHESAAANGSKVLEVHDFDYTADYKLLMTLLLSGASEIDSLYVYGAKGKKLPAAFVTDFIRAFSSAEFFNSALKHWFIGFDSSLNYATECMPDAENIKDKFEYTNRGSPALHGAFLKFADPVSARLYVGFESEAETFKKFNCYEFYTC